MKTTSQLKKLLLLLSIFAILFSCSKNISEEKIEEIIKEESIKEEEEEFVEQVATLNIIESISKAEDLSLLKAAIVKAGLESNFSVGGPLTLFAPTNKAIEELFILLGDDYNSFNDFNDFIEIELLKRILLYHGVEKQLNSDALSAETLETLLEGDSIKIIASGETFVIGDASEVNANLLEIDTKASNGILHTIDKILIPAEVQEFLNTTNATNSKTISELVQENEDFSLLKDALEITGLLDTLNEDGTYTVFAPTNDSFGGIYALLGAGITSLDDIDTTFEIDLLRDVLSYHVLKDVVNFSDITEGEIATLSGGNKIKISLTSNGYELIDATTLGANFILTDIPTKNGVIHTIDRVLLPQSVIDDLSNETSRVFAAALENLDNCNVAHSLFKTLQSSLGGFLDKEFTFFIPSDVAFIKLIQEKGYTSLEEFNTAEDLEMLKNIFKYHCIESGKLMSSNIINNENLDTAQGENITLLVNNNGIYIKDKTDSLARISKSNNEVLRGVIHVIDKVLVPEKLIDVL
ncbi:fasciclin domain-containing protein [uncultured Maribacter sp.]|uniref:fasciclin domain-containing protein n=1 Tax=uncultured Maribacter sp. TaxID=431308 RepID=UPI002612B00F|nr:fasciclin domain-containing protein [uncultured Maribacter sp.]